MNSFDEIHQVLNKLINENKALHTQAKLLDSFVEIARSSADKAILKSALRKILSASIIISRAETGSMFLFDSAGAIREKILTNNVFSKENTAADAGNVLEHGLAGWVMRHRKVTCIDDTLRDERWVMHSDRQGKVRSALAIPIQRGKRLMGLITLQHAKPYKFTQDKTDLMQALADQIALVLENIDLYAKLEASYRALNQAKEKVDAYSNLLSNELRKGQEIQKEFFPVRPPAIAGWRFQTFFKPAMQLSGDFFDIFQLPENQIGIVIADVCDKGVGAALYMALFRSLVRIFSGSFHPYAMPSAEMEHVAKEALKSISRTNEYIVTFHDRMATFATMFFGILDTREGAFAYINAGHEPPALLRASGERERLMPTGPAVGAFPEVSFSTKYTTLHPGDIFFGFTDGVTDAVSPLGEAFGKARLEMLLDQHAKSARDFEAALKQHLFDHIGDAAQADDVTFLVVKRIQDKETP
jgi:sigma-B regulation protein RsbU (phosphoserine phosphatase)